MRGPGRVEERLHMKYRNYDLTAKDTKKTTPKSWNGQRDDISNEVAISPTANANEERR